MQNTPFLTLLRPIFALKTKAAPLLGVSDKNWSKTKRDWDQKTGLQPGWRPFFFFGDHPNLKRKTVSISVKTFFFWRSPKFRQKNRLNLIADRSKSGSRLFDVVSSLQNSPLTANFWLHTCLSRYIRRKSWARDLFSCYDFYLWSH